MSKRLNLRFLGPIIDAVGKASPGFARWADGIERQVNTTETTITQQGAFNPVAAPFVMPGGASLPPVAMPVSGLGNLEPVFTPSEQTDLSPVSLIADLADPLPPV